MRIAFLLLALTLSGRFPCMAQDASSLKLSAYDVYPGEELGIGLDAGQMWDQEIIFFDSVKVHALQLLDSNTALVVVPLSISGKVIVRVGDGKIWKGMATLNVLHRELATYTLIGNQLNVFAGTDLLRSETLAFKENASPLSFRITGNNNETLASKGSQWERFAELFTDKGIAVSPISERQYLYTGTINTSSLKDLAVLKKGQLNSEQFSVLTPLKNLNKTPQHKSIKNLKTKGK